MVRIATIIALLLSVVVMIKGIATVWLDKSALVATKAAKEQKAVPVPLPTPPHNPPVPATLPDLKPGYLFNPERTLVDAPPPAPAVETPAETGEDKTPGVKIDDITYVGSVIGDTFKKALVSYPPLPAPKSQIPNARGVQAPGRGAAGAPVGRGQAAAPGLPGRGPGAGGVNPRLAPGKAPLPGGGGGRPTPPAAGKGGSKAIEHIQLVEGDIVGGYKLAGIFPDKLVFAKGAEQIEKKIYDSSKQRVVPAAPPPTANNPRPDAQGNVPPPPIPVTRAITVPPEGAAAESAANPNPSEAGVVPPGEVAPAAPVPGEAPPPAATATPPAPPVTPSAASTPSAPAAQVPPVPVRRMIVTRPAPFTVTPDTSSVVRGGRGE